MICYNDIELIPSKCVCNNFRLQVDQMKDIVQLANQPTLHCRSIGQLVVHHTYLDDYNHVRSGYRGKIMNIT